MGTGGAPDVEAEVAIVDCGFESAFPGCDALARAGAAGLFLSHGFGGDTVAMLSAGSQCAVGGDGRCDDV